MIKVGEKHQATPGQVALAWLMAKKPFIVPIPGARIISHMQENMGAVKVKLSENDINELETSFKEISLYGDRAPENLKASHDIGTSLGTSSKGTFDYNTLEAKLLKENGVEILNSIFGTSYSDETNMHLFMRANKTEYALKIFDSSVDVVFPKYIIDSLI